MRLSEMYYTIKNVLDHWVDPSFKDVPQKGGAPLYLCSGVDRICHLLDPIQCLPDIEEYFSKIRHISPTLIEGTPYHLDGGKRTEIERLSSMLHIKLRTMRSMCEALGMDGDSDGFDVKLPPDITLGDAAQCMGDLDTIFSQCPIFPDDTQIKFSGVDIGSTWLTFVIVGAGIAAALRAVAELVDKVIIIRSHWISYKEEEEHLRSIELSNEIVESIVSAHKAALDKMTADTVQELSSNYNVTENEDQERLRMSIKRLGKWLDRGMEIHANINAPKETKLLFPPIEKQALPQEIIKELGEATKDE